jgi:hypothetical protein
MEHTALPLTTVQQCVVDAILENPKSSPAVLLRTAMLIVQRPQLHTTGWVMPEPALDPDGNKLRISYIRTPAALWNRPPCPSPARAGGTPWLRLSKSLPVNKMTLWSPTRAGQWTRTQPAATKCNTIPIFAMTLYPPSPEMVGQPILAASRLSGGAAAAMAFRRCATAMLPSMMVFA